ncbi:retrotransposon protein, putative, ty3-gypsy subclass [Tanacetum coccineum]
MVFNYKSLNDNTYKDQYSLPGINTIIKRIGGAKIFSKFDLKLGFHQVAMDEESIPWTTFLVPGGLYEWLAMPFGLKNAPAVFQRKMDKCFKGTESFIAVYIDDILVFSKNEKDHVKHLERMLKICEDNIWSYLQQATHKIKDINGIEMLIGANFLRSMKGGIRIEGDEITIYKKVTKIKTSNQTEIVEIAELEVSEEEFLEINESIYFNQEGSRAFQEQFKPVIDRLKQQGYIGEEPLKH